MIEQLAALALQIADLYSQNTALRHEIGTLQARLAESEAAQVTAKNAEDQP